MENSKISILAKRLVFMGIFASITSASAYLSNLSINEQFELYNSTKDTKIKNSIKVAAITGQKDTGDTKYKNEPKIS